MLSLGLTVLSLLFTCVDMFAGTRQANILFAGDAMMHQAQIDAARNVQGEYDYSLCFTQIAPEIQAADLAVVNLETPVGPRSVGSYTGYPCFFAPPSYVDALRDAGFDVFLTANNHTLDRRSRGLCSTIEELDKRSLTHLGTYKNSAERARALPLIKEVNGIKIGLANYTYGTNGIQPDGRVVVDYIDRKTIASDVEALRNAGAEIICVCVHWGQEYQLLPEQSQKSLAAYLEDLGVDLIIGSHPHVIQPMEIRHSQKWNKDILLVYSLGNFISNMKTRDTRGGAMVHVRLRDDSNGKPRIDAAAYSFVFTVPSDFHLVTPQNAPAAWKSAADAFTTSARSIFSRHNIRVPEKSPFDFLWRFTEYEPLLFRERNK
ncbi:MAG: CapA family protein [Muribaculaceae bacterium]|nr:CapA family protein [Muribaculaceae bacterium]